MKKQIEIKPKKPRLAYVGMDKKTATEAVPTQVIEVVYPHKAEAPKEDEGGKLFEQGQLGTGKVQKISELPKNRLIWTNDNLVALKTLLDEKDSISGEYKYRNKIDLIYIDPPFMVQNDFVAENSINIEVDEDEGVVSVKEPTIIETIAYKDTWQNGLDGFLRMMRERLILMKELLSPKGSIYVHLDWHTSHYVKVLMDEVFDYQLFRNEIKVKRIKKNIQEREEVKRLNSDTDIILFYGNTEQHTIKPPQEYAPKEERWHGLDAPGIRNGLDYEIFGHKPPAGRHWSWTKKNVEQAIKEGRLRQNPRTGKPEYLLEATDYQLLGDYWGDMSAYSFKTGYPTEKNPALIKRIIEMSCPKNGIVLDAFVGSGTICEAAELSADELKCTWVGIDNSKFAIHTARKRLIELNGKQKEKKGEGVYKVRPFTVENLGYYQRGAKWDPIQVSKQADAYRQAIVELFGGEYAPYSKLLHGKKRGSWVHVGPLSAPLTPDQISAIAEEAQDTEFKKVIALSADFTAHLNKAVEEAKEKFGVTVTARIIPSSAIEEVKKRLSKMTSENEPEKEEMPHIAFFAPLAVKINTVTDGREAFVELTGLEVDAESFLESQKPERKEELKRWLDGEKSWQSFVDFWAVDWDYESLRDDMPEPIFENEWQSFRKRKGKKVVEDLAFKAFRTYDKPGEYTIAVKVTDVFGNDGIVTTKIKIK